jgi:hypothetical protein
MSARGNPNAAELYDETAGMQARLEKDIAAIDNLVGAMPAEDQLYVAELVAFLEKFGIVDYPQHGALALSLVARRLELTSLQWPRPSTGAA